MLLLELYISSQNAGKSQRMSNKPNLKLDCHKQPRAFSRWLHSITTHPILINNKYHKLGLSIPNLFLKWDSALVSWELETPHNLPGNELRACHERHQLIIGFSLLGAPLQPWNEHSHGGMWGRSDSVACSGKPPALKRIGRPKSF